MYSGSPSYKANPSVKRKWLLLRGQFRDFGKMRLPFIDSDLLYIQVHFKAGLTAYKCIYLHLEKIVDLKKRIFKNFFLEIYKDQMDYSSI